MKKALSCYPVPAHTPRQTVSLLQSRARSQPGDALAALFCCCGQRVQNSARGCFLGRGRTMQTAACCCGPRQLYRIPPATVASATVSSQLTPSQQFFSILQYVALPFRFLLRLSPVPQSTPRDELGISSRTVMHEIVRGGHWHLLEPSQTSTQRSSADVLRGAALTAAITTHGVAFANASQAVSGRSLFLPHDKEACEFLRRAYGTAYGAPAFTHMLARLK